MKIFKTLIAILLVALLMIACAPLQSEQTIQTTLTEELICTSESLVTNESPSQSVDETYPPTESTVIETESEPSISTDSGFIRINPDEVAPNGMTNRELLACVIYQEAGWDKSCDACRFRVGDIVLNRVSHPKFSSTIYGVLMEKDQYGEFFYEGVHWPRGIDMSTPAVIRALETADAIFAGEHSDVYGEGYIWQAEFVQGNFGFWCCGTYYGRS